MTTKTSIERLAASLVRANLDQGGFTVALRPAGSLERLAIQLESIGCTVSREAEIGSLTADMPAISSA